MKSNNQNLESNELLAMFQVEELDDRLEMCWVNCPVCTINSNTTNGTCCGPQTNGSPGISVGIGTGTPSAPSNPTYQP